MIRRNHKASELAFYRCYTPRLVPLAVLGKVCAGADALARAGSPQQDAASVYRALARQRAGEEREVLLALARAEDRHAAHWAVRHRGDGRVLTGGSLLRRGPAPTQHQRRCRGDDLRLAASLGP